MLLSEEIINAIGAHGNWKQHLRRVIETGNGDLTLETVTADNLCDFGAWLLSLSSEEKKSSHWLNIQQLHARFHLESARLFELAAQGKQNDALDGFSIGNEFTRLSCELTMAMIKWRSSLI